MRFIGMFSGEVKILEDIKPEKLEELKADFAWIDVDRIDSKTAMVLKKLYGIKSLDEFGFPTIVQHGEYDLILVNYFHNLTKKELQILMSEKFVITVHRGEDIVCNETMASLNEMLVSANFNSEMIFQGLMVSLIEHHELHLRELQKSLRSVTMEMKTGLTEPFHLFRLNHDAKDMVRVFYATKSQLGDIVLKAVEIKGIQNPQNAAFLYAKMGILTTGADSFSEIIDEHINNLMSFMWDQMVRAKSVSVGMAIFSLALAGAALFYAFFPQDLFGINTFYIAAGIIVVITMFAVSELHRNPVFRIS